MNAIAAAKCDTSTFYDFNRTNRDAAQRWAYLREAIGSSAMQGKSVQRVPLHTPLAVDFIVTDTKADAGPVLFQVKHPRGREYYDPTKAMAQAYIDACVGTELIWSTRSSEPSIGFDTKEHLGRLVPDEVITRAQAGISSCFWEGPSASPAITNAATDAWMKAFQSLTTSSEACRLLTRLVDAPSRLWNQLFSLVFESFSAKEILDASLQRYKETVNENYLLTAISLLEDSGNKAWPALRDLAGSKRLECELFVGLIAKCQNVPEIDRLRAMIRLAKSPHSEVKARIFDELWAFSKQGQESLLGQLVQDKDATIRADAEQYLVDLH